MGKHYGDNYKIVFRELWEYETGYYFHLVDKKNDKKIAKQKKLLINLNNHIKSLIVGYKKPYITKASNPKKYCDLLEQKKKSIPFEQQLEEGFDYFYDDDHVYSYNQEIAITIDTKKFHYWLAVKIRQYNRDIFELNNFLEYHFQHSFYNKLWDMADFLDKLLVQYNFIGTKAYSEVQDFIDKLDVQIIEEQRRGELLIKTKTVTSSNTNNNFIKSTITESFTLVALEEDFNFFEKRRSRFLSMYNKLRNVGAIVDKQYIDSKTSFDQFKAVFSGVPILPNDRIRWTGDFLELKAFVNYLRFTNRIVNTKNNIWNRAVYCFIDRFGNEIHRKQVSDANGSAETINKIERLLYDFPK